MPVFVEDPAHFSKSRLKSDLIAHNVALPPSKSKKQAYVELHMKHVDQKNAADFSSDEEDQVEEVAVSSATLFWGGVLNKSSFNWLLQNVALRCSWSRRATNKIGWPIIN